MSKYEQHILDAVSLRGTVTVASLAEQLRVTDQTIRRIVRPMVESGQIRKVHGAIVSALPQTDPPLSARLMENREAKAAIADLVVQLIGDGAVLAIDAGSTSSFVARALIRHRDLTVVTNSAFVASTLATVEGNRVFIAGTQLRNHDGAAYDRAAYDVLRDFAADFAILTASSVHPTHGFLVHDQHEADMARAMIDIAACTIMAVDQTKWRASSIASPLRLPMLRRKDIVVTDTAPGADFHALTAPLTLRIAEAGPRAPA